LNLQSTGSNVHYDFWKGLSFEIQKVILFTFDDAKIKSDAVNSDCIDAK